MKVKRRSFIWSLAAAAAASGVRAAGARAIAAATSPAGAVRQDAPAGYIDVTGATDCTLALQSLVATHAGKELTLPSGKLCVSAPITIPSGTRILGSGIGRGTQLITRRSTGFPFFQNRNLAVFGTLGGYGERYDQGIVIESVNFDYGQLNDGAAHAVGLRLAEDCAIRGCNFHGGNDATAVLASRRIAIRDNVVVGCTNVGIDNWDGVEGVVIEGNTITMATAASTEQNTGIMITGSGTTSNLVARTSKDCFVRNNRILGAGVSVFVNALDNLSNTSRCVISDNEAIGCVGGFYVTGPGSGHEVRNNRLTGGGGSSTGGCIVRIASEGRTVEPSDCHVGGNIVSGFIVSSVNAGMLAISGYRHVFDDLTLRDGSGIANGTVYYVATSSSGCIIMGHQSVDDSSKAAIKYGLFQGDHASTHDTNAALRCYDGWSGTFRVQG